MECFQSQLRVVVEHVNALLEMEVNHGHTTHERRAALALKQRQYRRDRQRKARDDDAEETSTAGTKRSRPETQHFSPTTSTPTSPSSSTIDYSTEY